MNPRIAIAVLTASLAFAADQPVRVGITGSRNLTLDDAVAMAMRDNLDVRIERTNVSAADQAELGAHGIYDSTLRWNPRYQILNTPSPSILSGANGKSSERDHIESFGLHQRAWQGALFDVSVDAVRTTTNNPFIGLDPFYTTQVRFALTQPLLRGRSIDAERAALRIRGVQTGIAKTELELHAIDTVTRVEQGYWDLVAARDSAEVNREATDLARTLLEQNRRMIAAGALAAVELSASEAELQRRLDNWYASLDNITAAENSLKTLIAPRRNDPVWNLELVPAATHADVPDEAVNLQTAAAAALKARPELREIGQQLDINGIEQQQNEDRIKPALNLVASYTNAGLNGTARTTANPFLAAIGVMDPIQTTGRDHSMQAGLNFEWTPRNREARANLEQTAIAARRFKFQRIQAEQAIEAQVRNAMQSLETTRQRINAAEAGSRAAKDKLDSEQRLFGNGESTNFLVLTRQNEYSDARQRLLAARADFNKAVARFKQAVGATLTTRKLVLD